jgi:hypothetical protein
MTKLDSKQAAADRELAAVVAGLQSASVAQSEIKQC